MMRSLPYLLFFLSFFLFQVSFSQVPNLQWGGGIGGSLREYGKGVVVDQQGNTYVCGSFENDLKIGNPPYFTTKGGLDIFLAKYDAVGTLLWIKHIGSKGADEANAVSIDNTGNVLITGYMSGVDETGTITITPKGGQDIFFASFSPDGTPLNAFAVGGTADDYATSIIVDKNNEVYLTGNFKGSVSFDPTNPSNVIGNPLGNIFLAKYSINGNYKWAINMGNASTSVGCRLAVDNESNIYMTGVIGGETDFDPSTNTALLKPRSNGDNADAFVAKYASDGTYRWAFLIYSDGVDKGVGVRIGTDAVYVVGYFSNLGYFGSSTAPNPNNPTVSLKAKGAQDTYLAKYNFDGDLIWFKSIGGNSAHVLINDLGIDVNDNIYLAGGFTSTVDFDPNQTGKTSTSAAVGYDGFISKYDKDGKYVWHMPVAGSGDQDQGTCLSVIGDDNFSITGYFGSRSVTNPNSTLNLVPCSDAVRSTIIDGFVAHYSHYITNQTDILSFTIPGQLSSTIDHNAHTVEVKMQSGTNLNNLTPTIIILPCAEITPGSGIAQNFTNSAAVPFEYNVRDKNSGVTQLWLVKVTTGPVCGTVSIKVDNNTSATPNDIYTCEGQTVTLSSTLAGSGIVTPVYQWQFSSDNVNWTTIGGNSSTLNLSSIQVANSGYYRLNVSGTLPDNTSCAGKVQSQSIKITVSITPVIAADNNKTTLCPGESTVLRISNGATGKKIRWIKDGSAIENPNSPDFMTITTPGTYNVRIENDGCQLVSNPITITNAPKPIALFNAVLDCNGRVTVTDQSSITDNTTLTYAWDFGDGVIVSTPTPPPYTYTTLGAKTITLRVSSINGCVSDPSAVTVNVQGANLQAAIKTSNVGPYCAGTTLVFEDASTITLGQINSWNWAIVDVTSGNVIQTSNTNQISITPTASTQVQKLRVTLTTGFSPNCTSLATPIDFDVQPTPGVSFTSVDNCDGSFTFNSTVTNSTDPNLTYSWDFGDGTTSAAGNPIHTYLTTGAKNVRLTVTQGTGCPASTSGSVNVQGANLQAAINVDKTAPYCAGTTLLFTDASTLTMGQVNFWNWTIIDLATGNVVKTSNTNQISFTASSSTQAQNFRVSLTTGFSANCTSVATPYDFRVEPTPEVNFSATDNCDGSFSFTSTVTNNTNPNLTYAWDFGDGTSSSLANPMHAYTSGGSKNVSLTVTPQGACPASASQAINVLGGGLVASIQNISTTPYCVSGQMEFRDNSSVAFGTIATRVWDFYDNNGTVIKTVSGDNPVQFKAAASTIRQNFTVRLTVGFGGSCPPKTTDLPFYVDPDPQVSLAPFTSVCSNAPDFTLTGGLPENGNGGTGFYTIDNSQTPVTSFSPESAGVGIHTIMYTFIDGNTGCQSYSEQAITVSEIPDLICKNYTAISGIDLQLGVQLSNTGTGTYTYQWSPATGLNDPTIANPVLTPTENTVYTVTVSNGSCTSVCTVAITIVPNIQIPNAFSPNGDGINDNWVIPGVENYPQMEVYIYDRYGSKIYYVRGYNIPWDGRYNGKSLPTGTYYYVFKPNQSALSQLAGAVTIVY